MARGLDAQNHVKKWYFGERAGLDFMTNPPTILTNGALYSSEGCSSASDPNGNILFYSAGDTVWNSQHQVMANGTGLTGSGQTTQSNIIVKQPGNSTLYYIFTVDNYGGPQGLRYSIVDMSLAAGLGSVTVKNSALHTPTTEKLTAGLNCNGNDVWILSHDLNSNSFRAYLLTSAGLSLTPVLSNVGPTYSLSSNFGQMKLSPDGSRLAVANYGGGIELYDFDPQSGVVSNPLLLSTNTGPYGCEFSPDGTKLYGLVFVEGTLLQWDLCSATPSAVIASQYSVGTPGATAGALQNGPNGKMYLARNFLAQIDVINNPNLQGAGCGYSTGAQSLGSKKSRIGLPNFVTNYFSAPAPQITISYSINCQQVNFAPAGCLRTNDVRWIFGDPVSGSADTSNSINADHLYPAPGTYQVKLIIHKACTTDTLFSQISISATPTLDISGSSVICKGEKATYIASGAMTYSWSSGLNSHSVILQPTATTVFTLTGFSASCTTSKEFSITVQECLELDDRGESKRRISIVPNPGVGLYTVKSTVSDVINILNTTGQILIQMDINEGTNLIDLNDLPAGIYYLRNVKGRINCRIVKTAD